VLTELAEEGIERVVVVPLAQHSADVYAEAVERAAGELAGATLKVTRAVNWGGEPALTHAFAYEIRRAFEETPASLRPVTLLLMTAHSLPLSVIQGGDRYEDEVRASAAAIARDLGPATPPIAVAFQSQGMGGGQWLGPDLPAALEAARASGKKHILVAPIGFLADHVEILYDLDIEAKALAAELGLTLARTRSLNASEGLIDALENVARPLLG
jgi:ferrochelatase